jgi:uncharacterized protein
MDVFKDYLDSIGNDAYRKKMYDLLLWVFETFETLEGKIAWNQPMFTDHGTFIIGFSVSKNHFAIAPELKTLQHFSKDIIQAGYDHTKMLMRIKWDQEINHDLLKKIITFNIIEKKECKTFWRKS